MVRTVPIRAAPYLPLTTDLQKHQTLFLNNKHFEDEKRFVCCFIAKYHQQNNIALTKEKIPSTKEDQEKFYAKQRYSSEHEPISDYI